MSNKISYNTKQKDNILCCIKDFGDSHFTAEELYRVLCEKGNCVGKTTVYRALERMTDEGALRKYTLGENKSACYQASLGACSEHFHLKCTGCGRLFHADCEFLSRISEHINEHHGFEINSSKTVFYGKCKICREERV